MVLSPISGNAYITQHFGAWPEHYAKYGMKGHNGIDFRAAIGTPVFSPVEGYITKIGDQGSVGYGKYIVLRNVAYDKEITLGHFSQHIFTSDQVGKFIPLGDLVGYSGDTGDATAPHLHMTLRRMQYEKIINYDNGYKGGEDFEQYLIYWSLKASAISL